MALTRQILDASNQSNRKANATQAKDNVNLQNSFNEYSAGNENDVKKIQDQYGFDAGEADKRWGQDRQRALYQKADVYRDFDDTNSRRSLMSQGDALNSTITNSAFMNPSYDGTTRQMATPELSDYTQDIAKYDTGSVGADQGVAGGAPGAQPGNLAVRAIAVNDKDFGVKKKTESELGYGV